MSQLFTKLWANPALALAGLVLLSWLVPGRSQPVDELNLRSAYLSDLIAVDGFVFDESGNPIADVTLTLGYLPEDTAVAMATTDVAGHYLFAPVTRRNAQIRAQASNFREHLSYEQLVVPLTQTLVTAAPIVLAPINLTAPAEIRFLFSGDLTWGRRFLGLSGSIVEREEMAASGMYPADLSGALIDVNQPEAGTAATIQYIQAYFDQADFRSANLHSPVIDGPPTTPHPTREIAYFTLPGSLPSVNQLGIDYLALGNDHIYDYLEAGLDSTFDALNSLPQAVGFSGAASILSAGISPVEERAYAAAQLANGYSFMSFSSLGFFASPSYVASDIDAKGGSAYAGSASGYRARYQAAIIAEVATGRPTIVQLHMGFSNSPVISSLTVTRAQQAIENGAALVIGHHAHIPHGFEFRIPSDTATHGAEPQLIVDGLGNFIYDQRRLETAVGLLAQVDLQGDIVNRVRALPIYIKDFVPRPAVAELAAITIGNVARLSRGDTFVSLVGNKAWVLPDSSTIDISGTTDEQTLLNVTIPDLGQALGNVIVDLRDLPGSVSLIELDPTLVVKLGTDLLRFGGLEDYDVDAETFDLEQWNTNNNSRFACIDNPRSGVFAICSESFALGATEVISNRNVVRLFLTFMSGADPSPNTDVSILGYLRAANAGAIEIRGHFRASRARECEPAAEFGFQTAHTELTGGNFDWKQFSADLIWPADPVVPQFDPMTCTTPDPPVFDWEFDTPRGLRLELSQLPVVSGSGRVAFDDLAVPSWVPLANPSHGGSISLIAPGGTRFLHLTGAPGDYELTITSSRPVPAVTLGKPPPPPGGNLILFKDSFEGPPAK